MSSDFNFGEKKKTKMKSPDKPVINSRKTKKNIEFRSRSWDIFTKELYDDDRKQITSDCTKLSMGDVDLFGIGPDCEPLKTVTCNLCSKIIKASAFTGHVETRHAHLLSLVKTHRISNSSSNGVEYDSSNNPTKTFANKCLSTPNGRINGTSYEIISKISPTKNNTTVDHGIDSCSNNNSIIKKQLTIQSNSSVDNNNQKVCNNISKIPLTQNSNVHTISGNSNFQHQNFTVIKGMYCGSNLSSGNQVQPLNKSRPNNMNTDLSPYVKTSSNTSFKTSKDVYDKNKLNSVSKPSPMPSSSSLLLSKQLSTSKASAGVGISNGSSTHLMSTVMNPQKIVARKSKPPPSTNVIKNKTTTIPTTSQSQTSLNSVIMIPTSRLGHISTTNQSGSSTHVPAPIVSSLSGSSTPVPTSIAVTTVSASNNNAGTLPPVPIPTRVSSLFGSSKPVPTSIASTTTSASNNNAGTLPPVPAPTRVSSLSRLSKHVPTSNAVTTISVSNNAGTLPPVPAPTRVSSLSRLSKHVPTSNAVTTISASNNNAGTLPPVPAPTRVSSLSGSSTPAPTSMVVTTISASNNNTGTLPPVPAPTRVSSLSRLSKHVPTSNEVTTISASNNNAGRLPPVPAPTRVSSLSGSSTPAPTSMVATTISASNNNTGTLPPVPTSIVGSAISGSNNNAGTLPPVPRAPSPILMPPPASSLVPKKRFSLCKNRQYDPDQHCGVQTGDMPRPCVRSLTCRSHIISLRRAVQGRSKPFDILLSEYKRARGMKERRTRKPKTNQSPVAKSSTQGSRIKLVPKVPKNELNSLPFSVSSQIAVSNKLKLNLDKPSIKENFQRSFKSVGAVKISIPGPLFLSKQSTKNTDIKSFINNIEYPPLKKINIDADSRKMLRRVRNRREKILNKRIQILKKREEAKSLILEPSIRFGNRNLAVFDQYPYPAAVQSTFQQRDFPIFVTTDENKNIKLNHTRIHLNHPFTAKINLDPIGAHKNLLKTVLKKKDNSMSSTKKKDSTPLKSKNKSNVKSKSNRSTLSKRINKKMTSNNLNKTDNSDINVLKDINQNQHQSEMTEEEHPYEIRNDSMRVQIEVPPQSQCRIDSAETEPKEIEVIEPENNSKMKTQIVEPFSTPKKIQEIGFKEIESVVSPNVNIYKQKPEIDKKGLTNLSELLRKKSKLVPSESNILTSLEQKLSSNSGGSSSSFINESSVINNVSNFVDAACTVPIAIIKHSSILPSQTHTKDTIVKSPSKLLSAKFTDKSTHSILGDRSSIRVSSPNTKLLKKTSIKNKLDNNNNNNNTNNISINFSDNYNIINNTSNMNNSDKNKKYIIKLTTKQFQDSQMTSNIDQNNSNENLIRITSDKRVDNPQIADSITQNNNNKDVFIKITGDTQNNNNKDVFIKITGDTQNISRIVDSVTPNNKSREQTEKDIIENIKADLINSYEPSKDYKPNFDWSAIDKLDFDSETQNVPDNIVDLLDELENENVFESNDNSINVSNSCDQNIEPKKRGRGRGVRTKTSGEGATRGRGRGRGTRTKEEKTAESSEEGATKTSEERATRGRGRGRGTRAKGKEKETTETSGDNSARKRGAGTRTRGGGAGTKTRGSGGGTRKKSVTSVEPKNENPFFDGPVFSSQINVNQSSLLATNSQQQPQNLPPTNVSSISPKFQPLIPKISSLLTENLNSSNNEEQEPNSVSPALTAILKEAEHEPGALESSKTVIHTATAMKRNLSNPPASKTKKKKSVVNPIKFATVDAQQPQQYNTVAKNNDNCINTVPAIVTNTNNIGDVMPTTANFPNQLGQTLTLQQPSQSSTNNSQNLIEQTQNCSTYAIPLAALTGTGQTILLPVSSVPLSNIYILHQSSENVGTINSFPPFNADAVIAEGVDSSQISSSSSDQHSSSISGTRYVFNPPYN